MRRAKFVKVVDSALNANGGLDAVISETECTINCENGTPSRQGMTETKRADLP